MDAGHEQSSLLLSLREQRVLAYLKKGDARTSEIVEVIFGRGGNRPFHSNIIACGIARSLGLKLTFYKAGLEVINISGRGRNGATWSLRKTKAPDEKPKKKTKKA